MPNPIIDIPTKYGDIQVVWETDTPSGGAVAVDFANGVSLHHQMTLPTGATTITFSNLPSGRTGIVKVTQPAGATPGTLTWTGDLPALSEGNSAVDHLYVFNSNGTLMVTGNVADTAEALAAVAAAYKEDGRLPELLETWQPGSYQTQHDFYVDPATVAKLRFTAEMFTTMANPGANIVLSADGVALPGAFLRWHFNWGGGWGSAQYTNAGIVGYAFQDGTPTRSSSLIVTIEKISTLWHWETRQWDFRVVNVDEHELNGSGHFTGWTNYLRLTGGFPSGSTVKLWGWKV